MVEIIMKTLKIINYTIAIAVLLSGVPAVGGARSIARDTVNAVKNSAAAVRDNFAPVAEDVKGAVRHGAHRAREAVEQNSEAAREMVRDGADQVKENLGNMVQQLPDNMQLWLAKESFMGYLSAHQTAIFWILVASGLAGFCGYYAYKNGYFGEAADKVKEKAYEAKDAIRDTVNDRVKVDDDKIEIKKR